MAVKKKKTKKRGLRGLAPPDNPKRKKARKGGGFKLETKRAFGMLPWPKHWGMQGPTGRDGARMFELTAHPRTVTLKVFDGAPGMFTSDHKLPILFSMEISMECAQDLAERLLRAASDARAFHSVHESQL